ncbi:hypothetical protein C8R45DRAFT_926076 [Mycena sanguinolenta]|nr:hypothetical protein C8R45DRAFT_926076 [Mycena sanguinolenta]
MGDAGTLVRIEPGPLGDSDLVFVFASDGLLFTEEFACPQKKLELQSESSSSQVTQGCSLESSPSLQLRAVFLLRTWHSVDPRLVYNEAFGKDQLRAYGPDEPVFITPEDLDIYGIGMVVTTEGQGDSFTILPAGEGTFTIQVPHEDTVWAAIKGKWSLIYLTGRRSVSLRRSGNLSQWFVTELKGWDGPPEVKNNVLVTLVPMYLFRQPNLMFDLVSDATFPR